MIFLTCGLFSVDVFSVDLFSYIFGTERRLLSYAAANIKKYMRCMLIRSDLWI